MTVPSAFSPDTGPDHWEPLLRARAIETGSFVLAPAQVGEHRATRGRTRTTWGHSLAIDPWGRVLTDGGKTPGVTVVDLDLAMVEEVRRRLPSLTHDRRYAL
jgi:predicted amidohydrolase